MEKEMNKPSQIVIVGGGSSISEGINLGLWEKLKEKFTFGINYSYKYFNATAQLYCDNSFYNNESPKMTNIPLIIGTTYQVKQRINNSIHLTATNKYSRDLSNGVYSPRLTGMFALTLAIYLLNVGEIFLLGYDNGNITEEKDDKGRAITHFYQKELIHGGSGKIYYYNRKSAEETDYGVYKQEKNVKIFNVSLNSKLNIFPKISYEEFFKQLNNETYDQNLLRQEILSKLKGKY
jgi:hypothetical protein